MREPAKSKGATNAKGRGATQRQGLRGGRAQVEERVLTAARELFAAKGYAEVTVREIAENAGVSHALVHRYCGTKTEILATVLRLNEEWIVARAGSAATLRDTVVTMLREIRSQRRDYFKLVARLATSDLPEDMPHPEFPATQRLLEAAEHEAGGLAGEDVELRTRGLVSAVVSLAIGWTALEDVLLPATGLDEAGDLQVEAALERAVLCLVDHYESEWEQHEGRPPLA